MLKALCILAPQLLVSPFPLAKRFPIGLVVVAVVIAGVPAFQKQLE
jgi:hypothetical protein